ncbi:MAG: enoyl-CoA hydratase [Chloroflexota bacterium]|nr:enoyl-CoA hydratase [Chloroflexota bacterium]NOG63201.1 enoyl-CoA hydratase [Chloroflexota bacterium]GIK64459.1 MAG: enoyl-CoA hydratase [Chloroflexota bacterium]
MTENILIERPADYVGLIRLNRPKQLNALNQATFDELHATLIKFAADETIRVVILTGNEKAFAGGSDITEMQDKSAVEMLDYGEHRMQQWDYLRTYPKPLIAAVSGWCLGGGNELAMACDMIVASETAKFGQPEISLAIMPGAGGTQRLAHAVGKMLAMEMVLAGRVLSAYEAEAYGLVNKVVPLELYFEKAIELAQKVAAQAPVATRLAKEAILKAFELALDDGLVFERRSFYTLFSTEDKQEGFSAYLAKRPPMWKGQ